MDHSQGRPGPLVWEFPTESRQADEALLRDAPPAYIQVSLPATFLLDIHETRGTPCFQAEEARGEAGEDGSGGEGEAEEGEDDQGQDPDLAVSQTVRKRERIGTFTGHGWRGSSDLSQHQLSELLPREQPPLLLLDPSNGEPREF